MASQCNVLSGDGADNRTWVAMVVISAMCHALFLSGVVFLPGLDFDNDYTPSTVEVDLVSLPASSSRPTKSAEPAPSKTVTPKEEAVAVPVKKSPVTEKVVTESVPTEPEPPKKEAVSISPEEPLQVKRSVKGKTYNVSRVIDKAIANIEKEVPGSRPRRVLEAIERLEKEGHTDRPKEGAAVGGGTAGTSREKARELLDIYNAEIWHQIQKNWAFSEEMAQAQEGLESVIIMKIMRDGEIRDIWFEKRSGNAYFDDSVLKAIKKSNPLPPLPDGFLGPFYDVGVRFSPSELRGSR